VSIRLSIDFSVAIHIHGQEIAFRAENTVQIPIHQGDPSAAELAGPDSPAHEEKITPSLRPKDLKGIIERRPLRRLGPQTHGPRHSAADPRSGKLFTGTNPVIPV
jgi:hypothetical protein